MNNPNYTPVDEFGIVSDAIKVELALPVLNFKYGYVNELAETLIQYGESPAHFDKVFPLIWVEEPFKVKRGIPALFGTIETVRVFIITGTDANLKAEQRMATKFKPVLFPIYHSLLNQLDLSASFSTGAKEVIKHDYIARYYWGEAGKNVLNDIVDCLIVTFYDLQVNNNLNC